MANIFDRQRDFSLGRLLSVARRRLEDAEALCATGVAARANGAMYLGGFAVEVMLKRVLLRRYAVTIRRSFESLGSRNERDLWSLFWRSHDLAAILSRISDVEASLIERDRREHTSRAIRLRSICESWTVFARYSTRNATLAEARSMLAHVRDLFEVMA